MVKLKTAAATVFALLLLLLGALLPTFVGTIQNKQIIRSGLETVQTGSLKMKEDMTLIDKLHVLANFQTYPMSGKTMLTEESLWEAVNKGIQLYMEQGLFSLDWNAASRYATPSLAYRTDAPDVHFSVWTATIADGNGNLDLLVDDETGLILAIDYASSKLNQSDDPEVTVSQLKDAYFDSNGLSQNEWDISVLALDAQYAEATCIYYGQNFGRVELEFSAFSSGFWTYILE